MRIFELSKSKYASRMLCPNISSSVISFTGGGGGGGGGGAVTVTRAVAVTLPPGPLAVRVYVVESLGVTDCDPDACTVPTLGAMLSSVALSELQLKVTD